MRGAFMQIENFVAGFDNGNGGIRGFRQPLDKHRSGYSSTDDDDVCFDCLRHRSAA
jgi:hypothetical protein